jgi:hypothetical protein
MESRIRFLLLATACVLASGCASLPWPFNRGDRDAAPTEVDVIAAEEAEAAAEPPTVIEPRVERRQVKVPKIDSENFEIGGFYGEISIEDFTAVPLAGVRADYHITEDFFFEAIVGKATGGKTSFETLSGNAVVVRR